MIILLGNYNSLRKEVDVWNWNKWNYALLVNFYAIYHDMKYTMKTLRQKSNNKKKYSGKTEGDKLNVPIWMYMLKTSILKRNVQKKMSKWNTISFV